MSVTRVSTRRERATRLRATRPAEGKTTAAAARGRRAQSGAQPASGAGLAGALPRARRLATTREAPWRQEKRRRVRRAHVARALTSRGRSMTSLLVSSRAPVPCLVPRQTTAAAQPGCHRVRAPAARARSRLATTLRHTALVGGAHAALATLSGPAWTAQTTGMVLSCSRCVTRAAGRRRVHRSRERTACAVSAPLPVRAGVAALRR